MAIRTAVDLTPLLALTHGSTCPAALIAPRNAADPRAPADLPSSQSRTRSYVQMHSSGLPAIDTRLSYPPAAPHTTRSLVTELYTRRTSRPTQEDTAKYGPRRATDTASGHEGIGGHRAASGLSNGASWPPVAEDPAAGASRQAANHTHSPTATTSGAPASAAAGVSQGAAAVRSSGSSSYLTSASGCGVQADGAATIWSGKLGAASRV